MGEIIRSGILVIGILLVRKAAMNRISRASQYGFWLFLAVYLIFSPFISYESNIAPGQIWREAFGENAAETVMTTPTISSFLMEKEEDAERTETPQAASKEEAPENVGNFRAKAWSLFQRLRGMWEPVRFIGILLFLTVLGVINSRFAFSCLQRRVFYGKDRETGRKIYLLENAASPFLLGRSIYVSTEMTQNAEKLRCMILHEDCHYRHGDGAWNVIRMICLSVYWYNPFLWLAQRYIRQDCELACDEAVLRRIGDESREMYGRVLVELMAKRGGVKNNYISTAMTGTMKSARERIWLVMQRKKKSRIMAGFLCMLLLLLTGCSFVRFGGSPENPAAQTAETENSTEQAMECFRKFYSEEELRIIEENLEMVQEETAVENGLASLKGAWSYGNYAELVFMIKSVDQETIDSEKIRVTVTNPDSEKENGTMGTGAVRSFETEDGDLLLLVRYLAEEEFSRLQADVRMEDRTESFFTAVASKRENLRAVPLESHEEAVCREIQVTPASLMLTGVTEAADVAEMKIRIDYSDGTQQLLQNEKEYVSSCDHLNGRQTAMLLLKKMQNPALIREIHINDVLYAPE